MGLYPGFLRYRILFQPKIRLIINNAFSTLTRPFAFVRFLAPSGTLSGRCRWAFVRMKHVALGACCRITVCYPLYAASPHTRVSRPCSSVGNIWLACTLPPYGRDRVSQFGLAFSPPIRFHAEVPLIALLRLMHLGISRFCLVLRRTERTDVVASTMIPRHSCSLYFVRYSPIQMKSC